MNDYQRSEMVHSLEYKAASLYLSLYLRAEKLYTIYAGNESYDAFCAYLRIYRASQRALSLAQRLKAAREA